MPRVVAVKLKHTPKQLWFDPTNTSPLPGDHVIVTTDRGTEIGIATSEIFDVSAQEIKELASPLKPVVRIADERDLEKADDLSRKGEEAMFIFRELIDKHQLAMKPVSVEYLFGGEKAIFYFSSDERVDFREFVRELASRFHIRIDMRQIGTRDEARFIGGISHCGEELCCSRMGGEFQPVSIRMAKEQDLPLNPLKISGLCGRLMCCLRYEFDAYKDFKSRAPKKGNLIETPLGFAKVVDFNTPREQITMRLEDGKQIIIPLGEMECDESKARDGECKRPCKVPRKAFEEHASPALMMALSSLDFEAEREALADEVAPARTPRRRRSRGSEAPSDERQPNQRKAGQEQAAKEKPSLLQSAKHPSEQSDRPTPRRRRRGGQSSNGSAQTADATQAATVQEKKQPRQQSTQQNGEQDLTRNGARGNQKRRRSGGQGAHSKDSETAAPASQGQGTARPRPGQHSSGIRGAVANNNNGSTSGSGASAPQQRRRPRRRHSGSSDAESAK